jgi:tetratricopeptide (TPR) repeat protein
MAEPAARVAPLANFLGGIKALRGWAGAHWTRRVAVAITILALIAGTIGAWAYLARVALKSGQVPIEVALHALDEGRTEEARSLVSRMLTSGLLPRTEYGGPLFVLGAVKAYDAEQAATPEKRRIDYLVASRYLKEARVYGVPSGRANAAAFLLGKSLLESNQFDEGIGLFDELLAAESGVEGPMTRAIHRLLAGVCLWMPKHDLEKSLVHSAKALEDQTISPPEKAELLVDRAHCLSRLGRFDEALRLLDEIPPAAGRQTLERLTRAHITFDKIESRLDQTVAQDRAKLLVGASAEVDRAMQAIQEARTLSSEDVAVARRAAYLRARGLRLQGKSEDALSQFIRVRQQYSGGAEALAADLFEGDMLREAGDYSAALLAYRRVLEEMNPSSHRGYVLPLEKFRIAMLTAYKDYVDRQQFEDARVMLVRFTPLFARNEELLFRAEMLKRWGGMLLERTPTDSWELDPDHKKGLTLLREAGLAYEQLAELEFATEAYTKHLWEGAENYYRGHSYSRAIELLTKYLANEPEKNNAQALLRLGQSQLALGDVTQSIHAFDECIEFHANDNATYQARIDCAKALWYRGEISKSEELLLDNLTRSALKPTSGEWKDSLFELGMLLYDKGDYERAIHHLEEAITRYEKDPQKLLAQYLVAESYRNWAEEYLGRAGSIQAGGERERNQARAHELLDVALGHFVDLQRAITPMALGSHRDPMMAAMLRNCYMLAGTVLFDLGRYHDAIEAYSNVSSHYPNDPFVLETFVQIANCWRRLGQDDKARGAIQQAQIAFDRLPADADFSVTSSLSRDEWKLLLADMERW